MKVFNFQSTYGVVTIQDMNVVDVDDNYARILGFCDSDELLSNVGNFLDLYTEEQRAIFHCNYLETIAGTRTPQGHTYTTTDRNGRNLTLFSIDHLVQWQGEPALQITIVDLTSSIEIENKAKAQDDMYRDMIMTSGQGILVHRDFKPLMVNESWVKIQGAESIEQVLSMDSILQLLPDEKVDEVVKHYQDLVTGKKSGTSTVVENIGLDGVHRYFNIYDNAIDWNGERAVQVVLEDVTDQVALEEKLLHQANYDELTDLYNRRAIYEWLDEQLAKKTDLVCLLMDIDDFKMINDNHGHSIGDLVIKSLASIVKQKLEFAGGVVGRWGGEEFIAFIPQVSGAAAKNIAEQICQEFNKLEFVGNTQCHFHSSISIGISDSSIYQGVLSVDALVRHTDRSLYTAKANGKNCVYMVEKQAVREMNA